MIKSIKPEVGKSYVLRNGRPAKVIERMPLDRGGNGGRFLGRYLDGGNNWVPCAWSGFGRQLYTTEDSCDLVREMIRPGPNLIGRLFKFDVALCGQTRDWLKDDVCRIVGPFAEKSVGWMFANPRDTYEASRVYGFSETDEIILEDEA